MDQMVDKMLSWNPQIDVIDLSHLSVTNSLGIFGSYDEEDDDTRKKLEQEIREQFMRETNEGMQR